VIAINPGLVIGLMLDDPVIPVGRSSGGPSIYEILGNKQPLQDLMIVTTSTPNFKTSTPPSSVASTIITSNKPESQEEDITMSTMTENSHNLVRSNVPSSSPVMSSSPELRSNGDLLDQNTLISYVYCFIKNFIG